MAHVDLLARHQYVECLNIYANNVFVTGIAVESKPDRDYSWTVALGESPLCAVRKAKRRNTYAFAFNVLFEFNLYTIWFQVFRKICARLLLFRMQGM